MPVLLKTTLLLRPVRAAVHAAALKLDYLWASLCVLGAVYFVFR
jgi:uncharacterized protein (DUF486 family)